MLTLMLIVRSGDNHPSSQASKSTPECCLHQVGTPRNARLGWCSYMAIWDRQGSVARPGDFGHSLVGCTVSVHTHVSV